MFTSKQLRILRQAAEILENADQEAQNYFFTNHSISTQSVSADINDLINAHQEYYDEILNNDEYWS